MGECSPYLRDKANAQENESILIIGVSGAVGSYAATIAKSMNLKVTGVCSTKNIELMKDFGLNEVIDYTKEDYTKQNITYDIIFDAVGKSSFRKCKHILKDSGRYLTTVPSLSALLKSLSKKQKPGKKELFMATGLRKEDEKHQDLERLEALLQSKKIKPLVGKTYPYQEIHIAQKYVETNHKVGNVFVEFK